MFLVLRDQLSKDEVFIKQFTQDLKAIQDAMQQRLQVLQQHPQMTVFQAQIEPQQIYNQKLNNILGQTQCFQKEVAKVKKLLTSKENDMETRGGQYLNERVYEIRAILQAYRSAHSVYFHSIELKEENVHVDESDNWKNVKNELMLN